jgi:hypothetical protein
MKSARTMKMSDEKCTESGKDHIYQFHNGMHRCACGKTAEFNDFDREWK